MKTLKRLRGTVIWHSGDRILLSSGNQIRYSSDLGDTFEYSVSLPGSFKQQLKLLSRIGRRVFRAGIRQAIEFEPGKLLLFVGQDILRLDVMSGSIETIGQMPRHLSLRVGWDGKQLVYGEYFGNKEREPVIVWASDDLGANWNRCHVFDDIRHVHAVTHDPFDDCFWITTGDYGDESAIWRMSPDLGKPQPIIRGDQSCRAIEVLVYEDQLIYGTDTPLTQNYIFAVDKQGEACRPLCEVGGSVFYARDVGGELFFTTAVEPSEFNSNRYAELWRRDRAAQWAKVDAFRKDIWPMGLGQFGQVKIPSGPGNGHGLWVTPFATVPDQTSLLLDLSSETDNP